MHAHMHVSEYVTSLTKYNGELFILNKPDSTVMKELPVLVWYVPGNSQG